MRLTERIRKSKRQVRNNAGTVTKQFFDFGQKNLSTNLFYTKDSLGSVRELVDTVGSTRAQYTYDPFGRSTKLLGDLFSDFQFAGYFTHLTSGFYTTLYREYDPEKGKWLSRDLLPGKNLRFYNYTDNDPINSTDPLGLFPNSSSGSQFTDAIDKVKKMCECCLPAKSKRLEACKKEAESIANALSQSWTSNYNNSALLNNVGANRGGRVCYSWASTFQTAVQATNPQVWQSSSQTVGLGGWWGGWAAAHYYNQLEIGSPSKPGKCKFWIDDGYGDPCDNLMHWDKPPVLAPLLGVPYSSI